MTSDHRNIRGFTLIELVLVLAVMALLVGLAAPSMRGWSRGAKLRDATDQLLAATGSARAEAIATAQVHLLEVRDGGLAYRVVARTQEGDVPAAGEFGQAVAVNEHLRIEIVRLDGTEGAAAFYPDGRVTPAVIRVRADWGEVVEVVARTPGASFAVVKGGRG